MFDAACHMCSSMTPVSTSFETNAKDWVECFEMYDDFGPWFLSEIHVRIQRFIASCALGLASRINFDAVDFTELINRCINKECIVVTPPWLKILRIKNQKRRGNEQERHGNRGGHGGGGRGGGGRGGRGDNKRAKFAAEEVMCKLNDRSLLLKEGEEFVKIFQKSMKLGETSPKLDAGVPMCHKWMGKGSCRDNCFHADAHVNRVSTGEKKRWCSYMNKLRTKFKNKGRNVGNPPPTPPPAEAAAETGTEEDVIP